MISDTKNYYSTPQDKFPICSSCPYHDCPRTRDTPDLEDGCDILLVGNKPSRDDVPLHKLNWKGKPETTSYGDPVLGDTFVGKKWHGLKSFITRYNREHTVDAVKFGLTYAVMCYNKEKGKADDLKTVQQQCGILLREKIRRSNAKVVLLLGRQACKTIKKEEFSSISTIDSVRGKIFKASIDGRNIFYVPTHGIDDVVDDPSLWSTVLLDINKSINLVKHGFTKPPIHDLFKDYKYPKTSKQISKVLTPLVDSKSLVAFDIESTTLDPLSPDAKVIAISIAWGKGQAAAIDTRKLDKKSWDLIKEFLESSTPKVAHNASFDTKYLQEVKNIFPKRLVMDTMLSHYIIDENRAGGEERTVSGEYTLKKLVWDFLPEYGGYEEEGDVVGMLKAGKASEIKASKLLPYAAADADVTLQLAKKQIPALLDLPIQISPKEFEDYKKTHAKSIIEKKRRGDLWWLATELMPRASNTIATLERGGMSVDQKYLEDVTNKSQDLIERLRGELEKPYGLNLNKPADVGKLLFDILKLSPLKITKSGNRSTDKKSMVAIEAQIAKGGISDEVAMVVEQLQAYKKLKQAYNLVFKKLPSLINKDGRVHPSYRIVGTVTGRLSCSNPNLQQIQKSVDFTLDGVRQSLNVKKIFVPDKGHVLLAADYSQIEMCILAALSKDVEFIAAIQLGLDLHCFVASKVFGVPYSEMLNKAKGKYTKEQLKEFKEKGEIPPKLVVVKAYEDMRSRAKAVGFGIVYGTTAYGLALNLGIDKDEAQSLIDQFFLKFPGVRRYIDSAHREAAKFGFVVNTIGRRRRFPIKDVRLYGLDNASKRQAQNAKIQGAAADFNLEALCDMTEFMPTANGRVNTNVHDAIYSSVQRDIQSLDKGKELYFKYMRDDRVEQNKDWLNGVPISIDLEAGDSWGELMPYEDYISLHNLR